MQMDDRFDEYRKMEIELQKEMNMLTGETIESIKVECLDEVVVKTTTGKTFILTGGVLRGEGSITLEQA